ncbi:hypothetical protein [Parabacteroides sp. An277]|uniref:hypothetical protein n=1 Tax=Parabacteroides sp. An277 TaxID=1965619 RepID=UPI00111EC948|nr:hypothetical protein [Parabacteroides sp. An277]
MQITGTCYLAAIGTEPFPVDISKGINGYTVSLPEGCSNVEMTIKLKDNNSQDTPTGVTWTYTKDGRLEEDLEVESDSNGGLSITSDKITALPTGSVSLHLIAHYDDKNLEFDVTIHVRELGDTEWTRSTSSEASPIIIEL